MGAFDLRQFEKIAEDDNTATLRHPKGHTIVIAVKAIPKIQREAIKRLKLADGGKVENPEGISEQGKDVRFAKKKSGSEKELAQDMAKDEARGRAQAEREMIKPKMKGLAKGGEVQYYADDPNLVSKDDSGFELDKDLEAQPEKGGTHITINAGAPTQPPKAPEPVAMPYNQDPTAGTGVTSVPGAPPPGVPMQNGQVIPKQAPYTEPTGTPFAQAAQETANADAAGKTGLENQRNIAIAQQPEIQEVEQKNLQRVEDRAKFNADAINHMHQQTAAFDQYQKDNPINPKHFAENLGTWNKVSGAMGLFLGGLSVPFGGQNFAFDFLNKQIDRDISAQQQNFENKKTIWGAYNSAYHNDIVASNLAKDSTQDIYLATMRNIAAKQGTPQAWANYQAAEQKWGAESDQRRKENAAILTSEKFGQQNDQQQESGGSKDESGQLNSSILVPNAEKLLTSAKYNPIIKDQYPELQRQYNQALQAEKNLKQLNEEYLGWINDVNEAGVLGRGRGLIPHAVAGAAGATTAAATHSPLLAATATAVGKGVGNAGKEAINRDIDRRIEARKERILKLIGTAVKGTNLGSGDLNHIVEASAPIYGNERKTNALGLKGLRDAIINSVDKGMLSQAGMLRK